VTNNDCAGTSFPVARVGRNAGAGVEQIMKS
jgi:hypothetical protein